MQQETLDGTETAFNPNEHGLWARYKQDDLIDHPQWMRACNTVPREHVGTCRHCGGRLTPRHPRAVGQRTDYEAVCTVCGQEIVAPGGRLLGHRVSEHNGKEQR